MRSPDAVCGALVLISIPGLRGRFEVVVSPTTVERPRSIISQRGDISEFGRQPPLRKMISAACGVSRDSIAEGVAVGCPVTPFFASAARLGVLLGEERAHPARPDLAFRTLAGLYVGVGCFDY